MISPAEGRHLRFELGVAAEQIEHLEKTIRWLLIQSGSEVVREPSDDGSPTIGLWVEYREYWSAASEQDTGYAEQVMAIQERPWF